MTTLNKIILLIISLAISFSIGYFATPTKIETKTIVKTETVKVEGKTRIVYRNKITKPDGTVTENEAVFRFSRPSLNGAQLLPWSEEIKTPSRVARYILELKKKR
jgi:hypothetical protein